MDSIFKIRTNSRKFAAIYHLGRAIDSCQLEVIYENVTSSKCSSNIILLNMSAT